MALRESIAVPASAKALVTSLLRNHTRLDGRSRDEYRQIRITLCRGEGVSSAEVQLGKTRVVATVKGDIVVPFPDRPTDGMLSFGASFSNVSTDEAHAKVSDSELARLLERCVRDSRMCDTESLCICNSSSDYGGNVIDASSLAMMAALRVFRKPEVQVSTDSDGRPLVRQCHSDEKDPLPLALHHTPLCVTLGLFSSQTHATNDEDSTYVVDPTDHEENAMEGRITYAVNAHRELCAMHKLGGLPIAVDDIVRAGHVCASKAAQLHEMLDSTLANAEGRLKRERVERLERFRSARPQRAVAVLLPQIRARTTTPSLWSKLVNAGLIPLESVHKPPMQEKLAVEEGPPAIISEREGPKLDEALLDFTKLHLAASVRDEETVRRNMIDAQERSAKEQRELLASVAPAESSTATLSAPKQQKPAAKQAADATPMQVISLVEDEGTGNESLISAIRKKKQKKAKK